MDAGNGTKRELKKTQTSYDASAQQFFLFSKKLNIHYAQFDM